MQENVLVKTKCFAYRNGYCNALKYMECRDRKCVFYQTAEKRCKKCKESNDRLTCEECHQKGIY